MCKLIATLAAALALLLPAGVRADAKAGLPGDPNSVTLVGTFHGVFGAVTTRLPAGGGMGTITCNGRKYVLHFAASLNSDEVSKLDGKKVVVIGRPGKGAQSELPREEGGREGFVVLVDSIPTAADEKAAEKVTLSVLAKLEYQELESLPVKYLWSVTVHGETFRLRLASPELRDKAVSLSGELARVTGTIEKDGNLLVTQLLPGGR
jgi:hypothetical protein